LRDRRVETVRIGMREDHRMKLCCLCRDFGLNTHGLVSCVEFSALIDTRPAALAKYQEWSLAPIK
jgi:hypothetical protein